MPIDDAAFAALLKDVAAEGAELTTILAGLTTDQWQAPTPAEGWNIHDQVVHLAYFDDRAALGFTHPEAFSAEAVAILAGGDDWVDQVNLRNARLSPFELLEWFRSSRPAVIRAFENAGPAARTPWFGPAMSVASSATARLMETWAHGQDIVDTLGITRAPTSRLRHICHLGVITRGFSFRVRGLDAPAVDIRIELVAPDGDAWTWGPDDAAARITGTALDFALVVTQRRNVADTALAITPGAAFEWLSIAQAFAGNAGTGRAAGQFEASGDGRVNA